jgi:hypothetical protein
VDVPADTAAGQPAVLFAIPDGRTKNLGLGFEAQQ